MSGSEALSELKFKGNRDYVQGPDLFDAVSFDLASLGNGYVKDLTFRSFTRQQCQILTDGLEEHGRNVICAGLWKFSNDNRTIRYWVVETAAPVSVRQPFKEEKIIENVEIVDGVIVGPYVSDFSVIENIVAFTKKYHNKILPLDNGTWVFGQIVLDEKLPCQCTRINIENYQNIKNRFSRNRIILDGNLVGEIRFIAA
tara:strand:+ start:11521 stop:12117 length:597 start_codon:yes stop_codon:yes gene_type:complete